jgi:flavin reductase (DIM6/NTAB) family NADH-FMN oxidoreductase RutF
VDAAATLFAQIDRELWLVTAADESPSAGAACSAGASRRGGLIATFVSQASLVPELPRVLVGLAKHHHTWKLVEASNAFTLHLLGEEHLDLVWRFALHSGQDVNKLDGLSFSTGSTGSPRLDGVLGWLDCRVEARLDTGDRTVYLGEVVEARLNQARAPLTLKRALQLATPEQLREMKRLIARDSALDAEAIHRWRQSRTSQP